VPDDPDAVFDADGDRFVPTELARGPWDERAMHGGAPAALLARSIERHEPGPATQVARLTVELLRPIPLAPLLVEAHTLRPGKKVQLVEASAFDDDGTELVRMTGLRLREVALELRDDDLMRSPPPEPGELVDRFAGEGERRVLLTNFSDAFDLRPVRGWRERGPATVWFRLRVPLVAGEVPSPLVRVAAAADFGNGISSTLDWNEGWTFINPDLTVYLHRPAIGEWIALDAATWPERSGVAVAEATLSDERGRIGRSVQSLLLDRRPPPPLDT
jgi:hypothetical protein